MREHERAYNAATDDVARLKLLLKKEEEMDVS